MILLPFFVLAKEQSACGAEASTFYYPEKIISDPVSNRLYVLSDLGWLVALDENNFSVVQKIKVGNLTEDFAVNSKSRKLYALDNNPVQIKIYDASSLKDLGSVTMGTGYFKGLSQIEIDEEKNKIYVLDRLARKFLVIDGEKDSLEKEYAVSYAVAFWIGNKTQKAYFRSNGVGGIQELDLKNGKTSFIYTGPRPWDIALDKTNNQIAVTDSLLKKLVLVNGVDKRITKTINISSAGAPRFVSLNERLNLVAVTGDSAKVLFYDLKTYELKKTLSLPENSWPERVFFDGERKLAYVPSAISSVITAVDLSNFEIIRNTPSGFLHDPAFLRRNFLLKEGLVAQNGNFYLTYPNSQNISRLTPDGQITFVGGFSKDEPRLNHCPADNPIFADPTAMVFNGDQSKIYVANRGRFITVLDAETDQPIKKIGLNSSATGLVYSAKLDKVFINHLTASFVSIIDAKSDELVTEVKTGVRPVLLKVNDKNGDVYALSALSNSVTAIHSDLTTSEIKLGFQPVDAEYDEASNRLFVSTVNSLEVVDANTNKIIKTMPELVNNFLSRAGGKIIASNVLNNYFTVIDPATFENHEINFDRPFSFAYHDSSKKLFVVNFSGAKVGVFDGEFKFVAAMPSNDIAESLGTSWLAASGKYVYLLDDSNGLIRVIDGDVLPASAIVKTIPFNYGPQGAAISISSWLVDSKNAKLYVGSSPYPQVAVLYLADINKFIVKIISGRLEMPLSELILRYWWTGLIALAAIGFVIYRFLIRKREAVIPVAPAPKI